jgi:hypothetical protein
MWTDDVVCATVTATARRRHLLWGGRRAAGAVGQAALCGPCASGCSRPSAASGDGCRTGRATVWAGRVCVRGGRRVCTGGALRVRPRPRVRNVPVHPAYCTPARAARARDPRRPLQAYGRAGKDGMRPSAARGPAGAWDSSWARRGGAGQYACLVDGCEKKFVSAAKRRLHLVDKHRYPPDYDVSLTRMPRQGRHGGIAAPPPRLQRRPPATTPPGAPGTAGIAAPTVAATTTPAPVPVTRSGPSSPAAPRVPAQITFGHRGRAAPMFTPSSRRALARSTPGRDDALAVADDVAMAEAAPS